MLQVECPQGEDGLQPTGAPTGSNGGQVSRQGQRWGQWRKVGRRWHDGGWRVSGCFLTSELGCGKVVVSDLECATPFLTATQHLANAWAEGKIIKQPCQYSRSGALGQTYRSPLQTRKGKGSPPYFPHSSPNWVWLVEKNDHVSIIQVDN